MPLGTYTFGGEASEDMLAAIEKVMVEPGGTMKGAVVFSMEELPDGSLAGGIGVWPEDGRGFILITEMLRFIEAPKGVAYMDELHDRYHTMLKKMGYEGKGEEDTDEGL